MVDGLPGSVLIILQARFKSTRLPGKGLFNFFDQNIWQRVISISKEIDGHNNIVLAFGGNYGLPYADYLAKKNKIYFYKGDENNVLERFASICKKFDNKYVIRMTCDNYLMQPKIINNLVNECTQGDFDYAYVEPLSHYAAEVVKKEILIAEYEENLYTDLSREHVTYDIRENKKYKKLKFDENYMGIPHKKSLTLDTLEDLLTLQYLQNNYPNMKNLNCIKDLMYFHNDNKSFL